MHEAKKRIPDMALSVQSQARHQPASFAVGPERLMLRLGFDRYHRVQQVRGYVAMEYAEGGCYCGKVKFKVLLPAFWAGHCHCTQCQRLHGAAFVTWVGFRTEAEVIDPEKQFKKFSTNIAEQGFCLTCGSSFYFRYTNATERGGQEWLGVTYFARANFINDPGIEPDHNIFYDSHAKWAEDVFH